MVYAGRIKLGGVVQENTEPIAAQVSNINCSGDGALVFRGGNPTSFFGSLCLPPPGTVKQCAAINAGALEAFVCPQKSYFNGLNFDGGQRRIICCSVFGVSYNENECGRWFRTRENFVSPFGPGYLVTGSQPIPDGMGGYLGFVIRECLYRKSHYKFNYQKNIYQFSQ
ncbi:uncharacterized protein LOC133185748 [Saccostrea echinata]|uniref:uncharacterized protein LOC133185748 n=1 Tax=Saccostrea echinata TaxID=191078 RepID=UPI002A825737|nr:uncharacterized protein LOC133185748 [Saccostrea echinata]